MRSTAEDFLISLLIAVNDPKRKKRRLIDLRLLSAGSGTLATRKPGRFIDH